MQTRPGEMVHRVVECPRCGQAGFMDTWPRFTDSDEIPSRMLYEGRLFHYSCPVCGQDALVLYDCSYRDEQHRVLFLFSIEERSEIAYRKRLDRILLEDQGLLGQLYSKDRYQYRVISSAAEFCEKVRIVSAGYDDRAIELLKVIIKRSLVDQHKIDEDDMLSFDHTGADEGIPFIVSGMTSGKTNGLLQDYNYIKKILDDRSEDVIGIYRFDDIWAEIFMDQE